MRQVAIGLVLMMAVAGCQTGSPVQTEILITGATEAVGIYLEAKLATEDPTLEQQLAISLARTAMLFAIASVREAGAESEAFALELMAGIEDEPELEPLVP